MSDWSWVVWVLLFAGGFTFGVLVMALSVMARRADDRINRQNQ